MKKLFSSLMLACALTASMTAFAQDQMKQDNIKKDDAKLGKMNNDQMKKDKKSKKAAKKDAMKKDDSMKKDDMKKDDNMKNDEMKNNEARRPGFRARAPNPRRSSTVRSSLNPGRFETPLTARYGASLPRLHPRPHPPPTPARYAPPPPYVDIPACIAGTEHTPAASPLSQSAFFPSLCCE